MATCFMAASRSASNVAVVAIRETRRLITLKKFNVVYILEVDVNQLMYVVQWNAEI